MLREEAGPEWETVIQDFFERIVLFDLKVEDARVNDLGNGRWEITMDVEAAKFVAEGDGSQEEEAIDYMIDIGVFTRDLNGAIEGSDHVAFMEKRRVNDNTMQFVITVENPIWENEDDEGTFWVGIDPYNKLIDRNSEDNLFSVTVEE